MKSRTMNGRKDEMSRIITMIELVLLFCAMIALSFAEEPVKMSLDFSEFNKPFHYAVTKFWNKHIKFLKGGERDSSWRH